MNLLFTYRKLNLELYSYLLSCPIILDIPEYNLFVVHAGLLPDVPFSKQKPFDIMNMVIIIHVII